jgi:sorbitol-specific phosphotransferase system component IIA
MRFDEDLSVFFDGEFSTVATIVRSSLFLGTEISGIFDDSYQSAFGEFAQDIEGRKYGFQVSTQLAEGLRQGDRLEINGQPYQITGKEPKFDGKLTELRLKLL